MSNKILDAACLLFFLLSLTMISNIQEEKNLQETFFAEAESSSNSFTPESDEKTAKVVKRSIGKTLEVCSFTGNEEPVEKEQNAVSADVQAPGNRWDIALTEEEIHLLAKIVWLESRGEPMEGQQAVVEVILNRMASEQYPNTLYEVLSQGNPVQFCSWKNRDSAVPSEKEYQSIQEVLDGKTELLRNDTLYFSTFPLTDQVEKKIGGHYFCY